MRIRHSSDRKMRKKKMKQDPKMFANKDEKANEKQYKMLYDWAVAIKKN